MTDNMFRVPFRDPESIKIPPYATRRSVRARRMRLTVHPGGEAILTIPIRTNEGAARRFVAQQKDWLVRAIERLRNMPSRESAVLPRRTRAHYLAHRETARALVLAKLARWNAHYGLPVRRIAIRDNKSRWGSASARGNLNFSYRILFLPEHLQDYLIVHELCHLVEHNHGKRFWARVAETVPNHRIVLKELRNYR